VLKATRSQENSHPGCLARDVGIATVDCTCDFLGILKACSEADLDRIFESWFAVLVASLAKNLKVS
jgi:hypothetical protein